MQLLLHRFDLCLRHTFTIAHDSRDVQPTLIVELRDAAGRSGLGEATANPYYGVTIDGMVQALEAIRPQIEAADNQHPDELWQQLYPHMQTNPFALCALDEAANDLAAKQVNLPLYQFWGLNPAQNPITNFTIGIDTADRMVAKMAEMPWPLYKIKLGTTDDVGLIRTLRQYADAEPVRRSDSPTEGSPTERGPTERGPTERGPTERGPTERGPTERGPTRFRVDANCAWTADQTIAYAPELQQLGVEFIEQPLPADDWAGMQRVFQESVLPIIADESCIVEGDVARCAGYFHGVNVKLTKCGGLTPARRMLTEAKALGLKTMVGCMTESSVGISAIAHLLPMLDFVDMDGSLLITNDPATGVTFDFGRVLYASQPGTGANLRPE